MGTPEFARIVLEALWKAGYPIVGIISQPDRPAGRGQKTTSPPCALFARQNNIPLIQPENLKSEEVGKVISELKPDFIVVAAYGIFLPQKIIDAPIIATVNVHASLLPKYRGAAPINRAILEGELETGVSIMRIVPKMDAGPVYIREKCVIEETDTAKTLTNKLASLGAGLLTRTLPLIAEGKMVATGQDESSATYAPALKKEEGQINWDRPAAEIHNLIRGLNPWPGAHTLIDASTPLSINPERAMASRRVDKKILKIYDSFVVGDKSGKETGTIYLISPKGIHVACRDRSLCLMSVQLEGRKKMGGAEFARGYRLKEGIKLT